VPKLGNPKVIFLYAFIKKSQFFKSNKAFTQSLINFWLIKLYYILSFFKMKYKHFYKLENIFMNFYKFFELL